MNAPLLTSTHWGVYEVEVAEGKVARLKPFAHDPDPSPIGDSMPAALTSPARILRPAIRRSWLESGPGARTEGRGAEPFVEVPWDEALDLVAAELKRVKSAHGNEAIFAGSYGWGSAGRFHHAQSQVHRFMNAIGGYVRHVTSYSLGAGRTLLPHVLRGIDELRSRHTAWASLEKHCQLFVAFGGVPAKNVQVNSGGVSQHDARPGLLSLARAGVAFVNVSPVRQDLGEVPGAEWIPIRPNTDTAVMLALAHVLVTENLHDRAFLAKHCAGFERFRPYLTGETDGVPKSPEWAGPIAGVEPERLRALARRMAASRTFVNASWSLQRADHGEQPFWMVVTLAAMLGRIGTPGGGLGIGYGSVNAEGSWAVPYSGPVLPQLTNAVKSFIPVARISDMLLNPGTPFDYDGKQHRLRADQARVLVRRQSVPPSSGLEPPDRGVAPARHHRRARSLLDGRREARRRGVPGDHHAGARGHRLRGPRPLHDRDEEGGGCAGRGARRLRDILGSRRAARARRRSLPRTGTCGAGCATCTSLHGKRRRSTRSSCRRSRNSGSRERSRCRARASRRSASIASAPIRSHFRSARPPAGSRSIPSASPRSATTTARATRYGRSPRNGWARPRRRNIRCTSSRTSRTPSCTASTTTAR